MKEKPNFEAKYQELKAEGYTPRQIEVLMIGEVNIKHYKLLLAWLEEVLGSKR